MKLMGKSKTRLLVHKDMQQLSIDENVDIIITPQFYTFLKEELGVKFAYQAKQIAPSLFDDYLNREREYQFFVYRCEGYWCFFAYSIDEIIPFLEERGIKKYQIGKIFFIQELALYLDEVVDLGDKTALTSIDSIVTVIPKKLMDSEYKYKKLNLQKLPLHHGVSISGSFGSLIPFKETVIITLLLTILGTIFIVEGRRIRSSINGGLEKKELLLSKNPKLSSKRVRRSILAQYEPIDRVERKKRETISTISKFISPNTYLKELTINNKRISALIKTKRQTIINQISKKAKKQNLIIKKEKDSIRIERIL